MDMRKMEEVLVRCSKSNPWYRGFLSRLTLLVLMWWVWTALTSLLE